MRLTSILVAAMLAAVGLTSGWAVLSIRSAVIEMASASETLQTYAQLQRAVAGEAFAEASYRRAPGVAARARIDTALLEVTRAVGSVRAVGGEKDRAVLSYVTLTNARYVAELTEDLNNPRRLGDDRVAGPALDLIQRLLDGAIAGHRIQVTTARDRQLALTRTLIVVFPLVIGSSFLGLGLCWRILLRDQRLLSATAASNEHDSLHDALTGLANRRKFHGELAVALARTGADTTTVLFLDLDGFKEVNDSLGHDAGDQLLVAVGQTLTASVRGDLVARLGGDEFAILLQPGTHPEEVATRILAALTIPIPLEDHDPVTASASIGIASAPADGTEARDLLRSADAALYCAKQAGKGVWSRVQPAILGENAPRFSQRDPIGRARTVPQR
ncbi:GGDEF domain-containing protein [Pengzhenrongella sp.]|jgi:diguanylate cyclase (GGDEF)-like protein|uniref:GGDEF domain-containing protein n=1 Tax=Pengzhenrongella sp. TaxID=2888820 RepID=UPI002F94812B